MAGLLDRLAAGLDVSHEVFAFVSDTPQTLDQLRSDLSHESASRLALLGAVVAEWRCGRFHADDPARCLLIVRAMRNAHRRYALTAFQLGRAWWHLVEVLAAVRSLERICQRLARDGAPDVETLESFGRGIAAIHANSTRLVTKLTARHAVSLGEVVTDAVDDLLADHSGVEIVLEHSEDIACLWLPRGHAARWRDVVRNLVRNAAEAAGRTESPEKRVCVAIDCAPSGRAVRLAIDDNGDGMTPEQVAEMWRAGASRSRGGRGHGLTEAKRAFVDARAELNVASAPGSGTAISLDFEPHDIALPCVRPWRRPAWQIAVLVLVVAGAATIPTAMQPELAATVRQIQANALQGLGPRGESLWVHTFTTALVSNDHLFVQEISDPALHLVDGRVREALAVTSGEEGGPARLYFLDGRGRELASRQVAWSPPRGGDQAALGSFWQAAVTWPGGPPFAYVIDVRKQSLAPESIQVVTATGIELGAYLHPGQVKFFACDDFDGDGKVEFLFYGINNDASISSPASDCPQSEWHGCATLLPPPPWHGQAYPHMAWGHEPPAAELAYVLISPISCNPDPRCSVEVVERNSREHIMLRLWDGRVLVTDGRLRPLYYETGDQTPAARIMSSGGIIRMRVEYFHDGTVEIIDVPRWRAT